MTLHLTRPVSFISLWLMENSREFSVCAEPTDSVFSGVNTIETLQLCSVLLLHLYHRATAKLRPHWAIFKHINTLGHRNTEPWLPQNSK